MTDNNRHNSPSDNRVDFLRLSELILASLDGTISPEEFASLDKMMVTDAQARRYLLEYMTVYTGLRQHRGCDSMDGSDNTDSSDSDIDMHYTGNAGVLATQADNTTVKDNSSDNQAGVMAGDKSKNYSATNGIFGSNGAKLGTRPTMEAILHAAGKVAAIVVVAFFLSFLDSKFMKPQYVPPVVAHLTGSSGAKWVDVDFPPLEGAELRAGHMTLVQGFAQITYNTGARVVLQAPAAIDLLEGNRLYLYKGNAVAYVPRSAVGFMIQTSKANVVDYGTEFGVTAYSNGITETHVFRGQVTLQEKLSKPGHRQYRRMQAGVSGRVDNSGIHTGRFIAAGRYVRKIPQNTGIGSPGRCLDLADVIGGGNGFGTGGIGCGIDATTGQMVSKVKYGYRKGTGKYIPVKGTDYIDGIFVPDAGFNTAIQISSTGLKWFGCPDTDGYVWEDLNNSNIMLKGDGGYTKMRLGGQLYGTRSKPMISMHSNMGVTFDLQAMRRLMPGIDIKEFCAVCGLSGTTVVPDNTIDVAKVDFYVLLDGAERVSYPGMTSRNGTRPVRVEIHPQDRFLTLVVTDGGNTTGEDWAIWAEPVLKLKLKAHEQD